MDLFNQCQHAPIQWNFLSQTAVWRCEDFMTYPQLFPSPSSGCAGGLVAPQLMTWCQTVKVYPHTVHGTQYTFTQCTVHSIHSHSTQYTFTQCTVHSISSHSARYTVYPHTVHGTYALQVTVCSHNTDNVLTASAYLLLTKCVIFSSVLTVAPWWWIPCKPKHVEHFTYIRMF